MTETVFVLPDEEPANPCPVVRSLGDLGDLIEAQAAALRCEDGEREERREWRAGAAAAQTNQ